MASIVCKTHSLRRLGTSTYFPALTLQGARQRLDGRIGQQLLLAIKLVHAPGGQIHLADTTPRDQHAYREGGVSGQTRQTPVKGSAYGISRDGLAKMVCT
jgi:hypothetical protein